MEIPDNLCQFMSITCKFDNSEHIHYSNVLNCLANEEYHSTNCPIFRTLFLEICGLSSSRSNKTWFLLAYQGPINSNCFLFWNTLDMVFQCINNFTTFENGRADNITCAHHRSVTISIFGWRINLSMWFLVLIGI